MCNITQEPIRKRRRSSCQHWASDFLISTFVLLPINIALRRRQPLTASEMWTLIFVQLPIMMLLLGITDMMSRCTNACTNSVFYWFLAHQTTYFALNIHRSPNYLVGNGKSESHSLKLMLYVVLSPGCAVNWLNVYNIPSVLSLFYAHFTLSLHSLYALFTLSLRSLYAHFMLTLRSPYAHLTLTLRSLYAHFTLT